jgi:hypothetical protein
MRTHECDVVSCSETSAAASTQPYFVTACATFENHSHRPTGWTRLELPEDWMTSTRIVHNVLRLGESHIQLIALYCRPATGQQAALFNQQLMDVALAQARLIPLPLVIMGDLNATPDA